MRAFVLAAFLAVAWADCDTSTCYKCQNSTGCGWYTAGPLNDCRLTSDVPDSLNVTKTANGSCTPCQAGSCMDCQNHPDGNCVWYQSTLLGGKCEVNTSSTPTGYTKIDTCPVCNQWDNDCNACFNNQNLGCSFYSLPGQSLTKCRENSPSFAYSKVAAGFCGGNPCTSSQTCGACQAVNVSGVMPCAWYDSAVPALYGPKCDSANASFVDNSLYNLKTTCPVCGGSSCVACKSEANCKWVAVDVGLGTGFGQCLVSTATNPTGKKTIDVCPATCQVYSCSQCIASTACRWYSDSPVARDTCDLESDSWQYGTHRVTVAQGGTCPTCASTRCYECSSETGCGWYTDTLGGIRIPGTGHCKLQSAATGNEKIIDKTSSDCAGNPNAAGAVAPSFAVLAIAFFVYHN